MLDSDRMLRTPILDLPYRTEFVYRIDEEIFCVGLSVIANSFGFMGCARGKNRGACDRAYFVLTA